ncbi:hypothetical protein B0H16DRAFT_1536824 [Mycena metata]|uniref:BHLH domain-containing protein n=1 Tax=Mycena metata TaxID=1033252 RepID=A0AAD7J8K4_9AGAR|nr:hypothetical protein B0H16DRAFT_1536824 [Mycena metata]
MPVDCYKNLSCKPPQRRNLTMQHMSPPPPFPEFLDFSFDGSMFPSPPPLPSSADLFSAAETTDLLGFLDNFNDFGWENNEQLLEQAAAAAITVHIPRREHRIPIPISILHQNHPPRDVPDEARALQPPAVHPHSSNLNHSSAADVSVIPPRDAIAKRRATRPRRPRTLSMPPPLVSAPAPVPRGSKPLLSTPQKRLNHIMSEQKRRNAIRDGAGRPKGSGSRGKGQSKGKSGVLFRAVEYLKWLEDGRDALREEVYRVEAAAGIRDGGR